MQKDKRIFFLVLGFCCLLFDQLVKFVVDNFLQLNQKFMLLDGVLSLEKVYNHGAAFSLLENRTIFLIVITMAVICAIFYCVFRKNSKLSLAEVVGLAFVAGGAVGNLLDRLIYSHVVDFIQLEFIRFPIFNFADIFINIGVIILIVSIFLKKDE